jgi:ribosomal protein L16/L10AE
LKSADAALKKKLKVVKGVSVWLRVFPDIPVCVKASPCPNPSGSRTPHLTSVEIVGK